MSIDGLTPKKCLEWKEAYEKIKDQSVGFKLGYNLTNLMSEGFFTQWDRHQFADEAELDLEEEN